MAINEPKWRKVADISEISEGGARSVELDEGRTIALFNDAGKIHATDNQCPHMGYPLTRGVIRHGILTCDWHGRSFDLEAGGCFNVECDDLQTFPVQVRNGEIWLHVGDFEYKRKDEHLRLLWEGLLSEDRWTMSKAIALLLKGGVPEEEIVEIILRHLGRHIASSHGAEGGHDVSRLINGLNIGRRYGDADRLIAITTAACSAAGGAAERLEVLELPHPVAWEDIEQWVRMFSHDGQSGRIERCLFTAHHLGATERILPLLFGCAVEPHFLGFPDNLISIGYLSEVIDVFGWERAAELVFNLGAKLVGRGRGEPQRFRRDAVRLMAEMTSSIDAATSDSGAGYDEDAFVNALTSVDIQRSFGAVDSALKTDVEIDRLITTLVLLAADRMARTPVNVDAGWSCLTTELNLAASMRTARRIGGNKVAAKGVFHSAWLTFDNRWLNIPPRSLNEPLAGEKLDISSEDAGVQQIINSIEILDVQGIGGQVLGYLNAGCSGSQLLQEMGRAILWNDTASEILPTLRTVFEEWERCTGHPARNQLLVALARYATDIRTNKDSESATITAMRFADGKTTVEVFED
jgi:nitrite reductase/ring-hydroxylating ferredoxin subunit